jgi:hypothetical protein
VRIGRDPLLFYVVASEELVLPHTTVRERVPMASSVRGTVIIASLRGIRQFGHGDRYLEILEPRHRDTVASLTAATWLPMEFAAAHYEACEKLGLDRSTIESIGADAGRFIYQKVLNLVAKLSRESGVTPLFTLTHANKLGARTWIGSSFAVWQIGPKEARLEWVQQPLAKIPYFRAAFGSFAQAICGLFAQKLYVRELPRRKGQESEVAYRVSWV